MCFLSQQYCTIAGDWTYRMTEYVTNFVTFKKEHAEG